MIPILGILIGWIMMILGIGLNVVGVGIFILGVFITLGAAIFGYMVQGGVPLNRLSSPRFSFQERAVCGFCGKSMRSDMGFCPYCGKQQIR
jgi:hypothetical protein